MTDHPDILVLIVEDEPKVARAHADLVGRIPGFRAAAVVHDGRSALTALKEQQIDLVLLDLNLPDGHGLDLCRVMRAHRLNVDVIAVTSQRDVQAVRSAVALGIVQYILKPFSFRTLSDKLGHYRRFRVELDGSEMSVQSEIDRALATLRPQTTGTLPPGLTESTLETIDRALTGMPGSSVSEIAGATGTSRATARRYLEHLSETGRATRRQRHTGPGRPEIEYHST